MCKSRITVGLLMVAILGVPSCMEVADDEDVTLTAEELAPEPEPEDESSLTEPGIDAADPASATAASDCPTGTFCLWQHVNFIGRRLQFATVGCHSFGPYGFNDEASSWRNRTSRTFYVYWDTNCGGRRFVAPSGTLSSRMGGWNDEASSVCSGSTCP